MEILEDYLPKDICRYIVEPYLQEYTFLKELNNIIKIYDLGDDCFKKYYSFCRHLCQTGTRTGVKECKYKGIYPNRHQTFLYHVEEAKHRYDHRFSHREYYILNEYYLGKEGKNEYKYYWRMYYLI